MGNFSTIAYNLFLDVLAAVVPTKASGRTTQSRCCLFDTITDDGHIISGDRQFSLFLVETPTVPDSVQLDAFMVWLVKNIPTFKLMRLTRPISTLNYEQAVRTLWHLRQEDGQMMETLMKLHLDGLRPHTVRNRDASWRAMLSTMIVLVCEADPDAEAQIKANGRRSGLRVRRLLLDEVVSFLRQAQNNEVLNLKHPVNDIRTANSLADVIAPLRYHLHRDAVEVEDQAGHVTWFGFLGVQMTGATALNDLGEGFATFGFDLVTTVTSQNPATEAALLESSGRPSQAALKLAGLYRSRGDHPVAIQNLVIVRAGTREALKKIIEQGMRAVRASFEGVRLTPIRGKERVESAYRVATQTFLTPVPVHRDKQPATSCSETLISVGTMEMPTPTDTTVYAGQDAAGQPITIDLWEPALSKIPSNIGVVGLPGSGKTFWVRYIVAQILLTAGAEDMVLSDFKGVGNWSQFVRRCQPKHADLVTLDLQRVQDPMDVLKQVKLDRGLVLVIETTGLDGDARRKLELIYAWLWQRQDARWRANQNNRTLWMFDETAEAFRSSDDNIGLFIVKVAGQSRELGGRMIMITQSPYDLRGSSSGAFRLGQQALARCANTLVGAIRTEDVTYLTDWGIAQSIAATVPHFSRGDFLMARSGTEPQRITLHVTDGMADLLTKPPEQRA